MRGSEAPQRLSCSGRLPAELIVAGGVVLEVALVFGLGLPERADLADLGHDRSIHQPMSTPIRRRSAPYPRQADRVLHVAVIPQDELGGPGNDPDIGSPAIAHVKRLGRGQADPIDAQLRAL